jgi:GLPGLI family protein
MKTFVTLLCSLISIFNAKSQDYKKIDDCSVMLIYSYRFCEEQKKLESVKIQEMVLEIGKNHSKFYSTTKQYADSLLLVHANEHPESAALKVLPMVRNLPNHIFTTSYIYKSYPNTKGSVFIGSDMATSKYYEITEELDFEWKIENSSKTTILGKNCTKAICNFAGRDYIAWFTTEIPINDGPYKFKGLPGLIMKISDSDNEHIFELQEIKNVANKPIYFAERRTIKTNAKGYIKALEASKADLINQLNELTYSNDNMRVRGIARVQRMNNFIEKY